MKPFSWRDVKASARLAPGRYAADVIDQHRTNWCGACYVVCAVQMVEDRAAVLESRAHRRSRWSRHICIQTVMNHVQEPSLGNEWNPCLGGFPLSVLSQMESRSCPLVWGVDPMRKWKGYAQRLDVCAFDEKRVAVASPRRIDPSEVQTAIFERGPVVLEVSAEALLSADESGRAVDLTPREPNHAVCVVGWTADQSWIIRNSWGKQNAPANVPPDDTCVDYDRNECSVNRKTWNSLPSDPGFVLLSMAYPPLLNTSPSPWIEADVIYEE